MNPEKRKKVVYIFNHIMKSGGLSFSSYLFNNLKYRESVQLYMPATIDEFFPQWRAGYYDNIKSIYVGSHFASGVHSLFPGHRPCYLTMLREPLARFLSSYKMSMDIGIFPETFTPEDYLNGAWHNFMTLVIGDGDLAHAKKRLAEEYEYVGITEEYERSVMLLAHQLDLDAVAYTHANKSKTEVEEAGITDEFRRRFYRLNSDDEELYRFGLALFERRWEQHKKTIAKEPRPFAKNTPKTDVMALLDGFLADVGGSDSFLFRPLGKDDAVLRLFWGIIYRMSALPLLFTLLKRGRYRDLRTALENLKQFHSTAPFAHPMVGRQIEFFERAVPQGIEAAIGALLSRTGINLSRFAKRRLGVELPISSIGYLSFMDTDRLLALSGNITNRESLKQKIEAGLLED